MSLRDALRVAASGLDLQRARMEVVASNLANARTTRTASGGPYRRMLPVVRAVPVGRRTFGDAVSRAVRGVRLERVALDPRPPVLRYEPGHPDADARGYVAYPNVDPAEEMVDLLSAMRSYEANTKVVKAVERMREDALDLLR